MTQQERVLEYIAEHGSISQREAMDDLHVGRLSDVILKLRRKGFKIKTVDVGGINEYGKYSYGIYMFED